MLTIRSADQRGVAEFGWLHSRHSFSFGDYYDPQFMGYGPLRVINEDQVAPGRGFGEHGHSDMEIISYVLSGALEHKDSLGNGSTILPGDVQRMTAGSGIRHSEFNSSATEPVHFLQIWIEPDTNGLAPGYEQRHFEQPDLEDDFKLVGSRDGRDGSVTIHRDADLYVCKLDVAGHASFKVPAGRLGWLQVANGEVELNGHALQAGDGVAIESPEALDLKAITSAEVLLFDMI